MHKCDTFWKTSHSVRWTITKKLIQYKVESSISPECFTAF